LAVVEGSTENATVVTDLLVGLCDRGLDVTRPVLAVLDGAKALAAAVNAVFDHPIIGRCQLHKIRNVKSKLPDKLAATVTAKMHAAYKMTDALAAEAALADPASSSGDTPARPGRWARGLPRG
jgi:putative transposase